MRLFIKLSIQIVVCLCVCVFSLQSLLQCHWQYGRDVMMVVVLPQLSGGRPLCIPLFSFFSWFSL